MNGRVVHHEQLAPSSLLRGVDNRDNDDHKENDDGDTDDNAHLLKKRS